MITKEVHERESKISQAKRDLSEFLIDINVKYKLTLNEIVQILHDEITAIIRLQIRKERE